MNRLQLFSSPVYWISLVVLIANDFIFKNIYPGLITGKASDFAGLIILPLFIFGFFPDFFQTVKKKILLLAGSGTVLSLLQVQFFLDMFDGLLLLLYLPRHNLTADGSDLIALSVLPFIFVFLQKRARSEQNLNTSRSYVKATHILLGCVSFIALCATSFIGVREVAVNELVSADSDVGKTLFNIQQKMNDGEIKTNMMGVKGDSIYMVQVEFEDTVWIMQEGELKKDVAFFEGDLAFKVDQNSNEILLNEFRLLTWGRRIEDSTATRIFRKRFKPLIF